MLIFVSSSKGQFIDFFFIIKSITASLTSYFIFEFIRYLSKYIMKKDALGHGDSKLVAMLALWLGPFGTLFMVGISYIFAAIFCFFGLYMKFLRLRQSIRFAPFLSLGGLVVWFLGNEFIMEKFLRI